MRPGRVAQRRLTHNAATPQARLDRARNLLMKAESERDSARCALELAAVALEAGEPEVALRVVLGGLGVEARRVPASGTYPNTTEPEEGTP